MKIAIPNKGRIYDPTINLLRKAGLHTKNRAKRQLFAETTDPETKILFARTADIPKYVQDGAAELGITSLDFINESGVDVELLLDLEYGAAEMVLAAPEDSEIIKPCDITSSMKIVTEFPRVTREYFNQIGIEPKIIEVSGATEMTPQVGIADAIVDLTSTGTTLRMNKLSVIDKIFETSAHLIANQEKMREDRKKIREVEMAIKSVLKGKRKKYMMMNVSEENLEEIKEVLPGMSGPTVMNVESEKDMVAVHVVVDEDEIYQLIKEVKNSGAKDILVSSIDRLVS